MMQIHNLTQIKGFAVTQTSIRRMTSAIAGLAVILGACSTGPTIVRTQEIPEDADIPYSKILVITLLSSFDSRRNLENEVVRHLAELGTDAVASTSMMNTKTPMIRATFMKMVEDINADAVLVTQLTSLESDPTIKDMRPRKTVNFRSTYYYNVFSVEVTEYMEPQSVEFEHSLVVGTDLFSVKNQESVWAIESSSTFVFDHEQTQDYSIFVAEGKAIASQLSRDGLLAR